MFKLSEKCQLCREATKRFVTNEHSAAKERKLGQYVNSAFWLGVLTVVGVLFSGVIWETHHPIPAIFEVILTVIFGALCGRFAMAHNKVEKWFPIVRGHIMITRYEHELHVHCQCPTVLNGALGFQLNQEWVEIEPIIMDPMLREDFQGQVIKHEDGQWAVVKPWKMAIQGRPTMDVPAIQFSWMGDDIFQWHSNHHTDRLFQLLMFVTDWKSMDDFIDHFMSNRGALAAPFARQVELESALHQLVMFIEQSSPSRIKGGALKHVLERILGTNQECLYPTPREQKIAAEKLEELGPVLEKIRTRSRNKSPQPIPAA